MGIRQRILFVFFVFGCLPALVLACVLYGVNRQREVSRFRHSLEFEANEGAARVRVELERRDQLLRVLGASATLREVASRGSSADDQSQTSRSVPLALRDLFQNFNAATGSDLRAVYCFGSDHIQIFAGPASGGIGQTIALDAGTSMLIIPVPPAAWDQPPDGPFLWNPIRDGDVRYFVPLRLSGGRGMLVVDLSLAKALESEISTPTADAKHYQLVLDSEGRILLHTRGSARFQLAAEAIPSFASIVPQMVAGATGTTQINDQGIDRTVYFRPVGALGLSVAVVADSGGATGLSWTWLIVGSVLVLAGAIFAAWLISRALRREQRGIERVTRGAAEIAAGKLNNRIELESSTTLQPLADSFNAMTEKLREQIARETEARQFQSFMRLSATISHDLKNSIQSLNLLVKNLETKFDDPEYRIEALRSLEQATNKLTGLVGRLSEPVRSMSGELPRPQPADLVSLIRGVLRSTAELDQAGHKLNIDLPEKLIAAIDADRIEKVFENLIINAMQAMDSAPGSLTIAATADADNCTVTVSDTGVGMTEAFIRDRLFRPFSTTKATGIGLGLYTCREVVRAHGGRLEAESKLGSGTTFRVVLPLRAQAFWSAMGGSTAV